MPFGFAGILAMETGLAEFIRNALLVIGALFPIVNPLGNAPIFLALTTGFTDDAYAVLARKIALNSFALLVISILVGTNILTFFGRRICCPTGWSSPGACDYSTRRDGGLRT
jgi:hypothetical protein